MRDVDDDASTCRVRDGVRMSRPIKCKIWLGKQENEMERRGEPIVILLCAVYFVNVFVV